MTQPESADAVGQMINVLLGGSITAGLFAVVVWFITRYVTQRDELEKEIKSEISHIPEKIKENIRDLNDTVNQLRRIQTELSEQLQQNKFADLAYHEEIKKEIMRIEKQIIQLEGTLERVSAQASRIETTFIKVEKAISLVGDRAAMHETVLKSMIEWVTKSKDNFGALNNRTNKLEEDFRTHIQKINDDLFIIKNKKGD